MAAKGSRRNPYTGNEYENMLIINTWQGGWVGSIGNLVYHSCSNLTYTGRCAKGYPVSNMLFSEMRQIGIWTGGWVSTYQNGTKYFDTGGTEYDITLGSQSNPCPLSIYDEMILNEIWEGGWIQEPGDVPYYSQGFQATLDPDGGNGCGCGSGSGSASGSGSGSGSDGGSGSGSDGGSGSGSGSGSDGGGEEQNSAVYPGEYYFVNENSGHVTSEMEATIYWSEGNTVGYQNLSDITFSLRSTNDIVTIKHVNISCRWEEAYKISISGSFVIEYNLTEYTYNVNGNFSIPSFYRQKDK